MKPGFNGARAAKKILKKHLAKIKKITEEEQESALQSPVKAKE